MPMGEMGDYTMFKNGEKPLAECTSCRAGHGYGPQIGWSILRSQIAMPPLRKPALLGATTIAPPTDIPTIGRFSILMDPQGAAFALIKLGVPEA